MAGKSDIEWTQHKRCTTCRLTLPLASFNLDRSRADGHCYVCRSCKRVTPSHVPLNAERRAAAANGLAWCRDCQDWFASARLVYRCQDHERAAERIRYACDTAYRAERRAHAQSRKRGIDPVPESGRELLTDIFDGKCAYCPATASTWDHVIPVSLGGQTIPGNILPACQPCNSSKGNRDLFPWLEATGRILKLSAADIIAHFQTVSL